jgi:hypothetical protein
MTKFLSLSGLQTFWGDISQAMSAKADKTDATQSAHGLMSATDKIKLDGIEAGANNYTLPTMSASVKGGAMLGSGLSVSDGALSAKTRMETRQSGGDTYHVLVIE